MRLWAVINTDGTITQHEGKPSLEQLQKAVGGYIQLLPHFTKFEGKACAAYVDEEGRYKLPHHIVTNNLATSEWHRQMDKLEGPYIRYDLLGPVAVVFKGDKH